MFSNLVKDWYLVLLQFERKGAWHDIAKSSKSQSNNKASDNDNITVEFLKIVRPISQKIQTQQFRK